MNARYEIVHVIDDQWLIDSESYQRVYGIGRSPGLRPGVYIVFWSDDSATLAYDDTAEYLGPFLNRMSAELAILDGRIDGLAILRAI